MRLYEYESKQIFKLESIPIPDGILIDENSIVYGMKFLDKYPEVVLKSQVLTGGRGKVGGIKVVSSKEEFYKTATELFRTPIGGFKVKKLLVEQKLDIMNEFYLGVTYDKTTSKIIFIFSTSGGMEIEQIAKFHPESIVKYEIDILDGLQKDEIKNQIPDLPEIVEIGYKIYNIFVNYDTEIVEINPLVLTTDGKVIACDARISIYDDALPKQNQLHPNMFNRVDEALTELEIEARKYGLGYIELDGEIGVIGNGAGLNLATLDMLRYCGLNPSNFLEVSGRTYMKADKALEIILKKSSVSGGIKIIFGNFFGCISRCDVIARGLVDAINKGILPAHIPFIVAMRGNGADEGIKILRESVRTIEVYDDDEIAIKRIKEIL